MRTLDSELRERLTHIVRGGLSDWLPPPEDLNELTATAAQMNEDMGITDPDDMWTVEGLREARQPYAPTDDEEARDWQASSVMFDVARMLLEPHRWSFRRWPITPKAFSWLYVLGVANGGGCYSADRLGRVYDPPGLESFKPGSRYYLLGVERWKRNCLIGQLRGGFAGKDTRTRWHLPGPRVGWLCGTCAPCPECGEAAEHYCEVLDSALA